MRNIIWCGFKNDGSSKEDLIKWGTQGTLHFLAGAINCEKCFIPKGILGEKAETCWYILPGKPPTRRKYFLKGNLIDILTSLHLAEDLFTVNRISRFDIDSHDGCGYHTLPVTLDRHVVFFEEDLKREYFEISSIREFNFLKNEGEFFYYYNTMLGYMIEQAKEDSKLDISFIDRFPRSDELTEYLFRK